MSAWFGTILYTTVLVICGLFRISPWMIVNSFLLLPLLFLLLGFLVHVVGIPGNPVSGNVIAQVFFPAFTAFKLIFVALFGTLFLGVVIGPGLLVHRIIRDTAGLGVEQTARIVRSVIGGLLRYCQSHHKRTYPDDRDKEISLYLGSRQRKANHTQGNFYPRYQVLFPAAILL